MNRKTLFLMALRNLKRHRRRQLFLVLSLVLCFALISLLTLVTQGMGDNVNASSRVHYGGDLFLLGISGDNRDKPLYVEETKVLEELARSLPGVKAKRSQLFKKAYLYFNGAPQLLKNVVGLDYQVEKDFLNHYQVAAGSLDFLAEPGYVALSSALAERMNIRAGDRITLKTTDLKNRFNTGDYTVGALINDDTLLGYYRLFMNRSDLNKQLDWKEDAFSSLGVYLDDPDRAGELASEVLGRLDGQLDAGGPIDSREDYYREVEKSWKGIRYFCYPLGVYVSEVDDLLRALDLVSYFIYLMMLLITFVSVLVTYRILLHDRSRELAVLQSMGMTGGQVTAMLLAESGLLLGLSLAAGFILSLLLTGALGFASFDWIEGFGIFLKRGRLTGKFLFSRFLFNICVIILGVVPAVLLQVRRELNRPLADILKGEK